MSYLRTLFLKKCSQAGKIGPDGYQTLPSQPMLIPLFSLRFIDYETYFSVDNSNTFSFRLLKKVILFKRTILWVKVDNLAKAHDPSFD